jgi:hypothetical protein
LIVILVFSFILFSFSLSFFHSLTHSLTHSLSLSPFLSLYQHWIAQPREKYLETKEIQIMQGLKVTEVKSMKYITDKKVSEEE